MTERLKLHNDGGRTRDVAEAGQPGEDEFRVDIERIRFSPFFSRLAAVTQVIPQAGSGTVIHNRLTHSLKVSAVARSIAINLNNSDERTRSLLSELGGCDPVVVQAAAAAHDLGHPPFGHLGEKELDRVARTVLHLPDGFEGNAQTFRILTALDSCDATARGLNLTRAVKAAVLKYPWARSDWTTQQRLSSAEMPRGVGDETSQGAMKFSAYMPEIAEMHDALSAFPRIVAHQQTLECAVMDVADDVAYAVHDLDDFYRSNVLQYTSVSAELSRWLSDCRELGALHDTELDRRRPGHALESMWRHIQAKDPWIADEDAFRQSVQRINRDLVEGLLAVPYDGGLEADRAVTAFTRRWIDRLKASIVVDSQPHVRSGHVRLSDATWHDVVVLKFVHSRFVLERSDLAVYQRGQTRIIASLVEGFHEWLRDPDEATRIPRRLLDSVEAATQEYQELYDRDPDSLGEEGATAIIRLGRARAVVDYIASFTDAQAMSVNALITGSSDEPWEAGRGL
ncbi:deoxyguanosinetriphosphate triphosphohydrolase family protein [Brevibacterium sp. FME17]|uniref:deoxyguanosinetriphosphate triphosphohydrolase family protein n=1 Tax=Brevibacterium sp. FME17 TaxID=2742606 RepID=UPI001866510C|nr:dNTP triphosphohydrolase [Brevibacterium sp. FME17]